MSVRVEIDLDEKLLEALAITASKEGLSLASFVERVLHNAIGRTSFAPAEDAGKFLSLSRLVPEPPYDFKTFDEILELDK